MIPGFALPGDLTEPEIVRWLRATAPLASAIPPPLATPQGRAYTRTLLHRCDDFELVVIHWPGNAVSAIHDHGGARCWLAVASGTMRVENFLRFDAGTEPGRARIRPEASGMLAAGEIDYRQDDVHIHRCVASDGPVVSLHLYAQPIDRFNAFEERGERCFEVTSTYDAVLTRSSANA